MKTNLLTLLALLLLQTTKAQMAPSSCYPSPGFQNAYHTDVLSLACIRMYETKHPDTVFVTVPPIHLDTIWGAIASVFNLANQYETDSVFAKHCIHKSPYYETVITVHIDSTFGWTNAWLNLNNVTGYGALDSFMQKYDLHIFYISNAHYADIQTLSPLFPFNMKALADSIKQFIGIDYARANYFGGDGNDIEYYRDQDSTKFTFWIKWGDCASGCINAKCWNYAVTPSCEVIYNDTIVYIQGNGGPYPVPINCNLAPDLILENYINSTVNIYPNPTLDRLFIKNAKKSKYQKYKIFDLRGIVLFQKEIDGSDIIDVGELKSGMYFIVFENDKKAPSKHLFVKL